MNKFQQQSFTSFKGGFDGTSPDGSVGIPAQVTLIESGAIGSTGMRTPTFEIDTLRTMNGASTKDGGVATNPGKRYRALVTSAEVMDFAYVPGLPGGDTWFYVIKAGADYKFIRNVAGTETLIAQWTPEADFGGTAVGVASQEVQVLVAGPYVVAIADRIHVYNTISGNNRRAGYFPTVATLTNVLFFPGATGAFYKDGIPGTVGDAYQYVFVEQDADGAFTNPGAISSGFFNNVRSDFKLNIRGIAAATVPTPPSLGTGYVNGTAGTGKIWVFRLGNANSLFRLVGTFTPKVLAAPAVLPDGTAAIALDVIDNATGNYFLDNVSDEFLPDTFPSYSSLPPPGNVRTACWADGLLYFAGLGNSVPAGVYPTHGSCLTGSHLWHTRPNLLDSIGFEDDGADNDGGFVILDGEPSDDILQIITTGGVKIVGRKRSVYAVYGSGFQSSRYDKRGNVGFASRRAGCRCDNTIRYVASDRTVRELGDSEGVVISDQIRKQLLALDYASFNSVVTFYSDGIFYVSFPVGTTPKSCKCFAYNETYRTWYELSTTVEARNYWRCNAGHFYKADNGYGNFGGTLFVARTVDDPSIGIYTASDTWDDLGLGKVDCDLLLETDLRPFGNTTDVGRFIAFTLEGENIIQGTTPVVVDLICDGVTYTYSLTNLTGTLVNYVRLPPDLVGKAMKAKVYGQWKSGRITKMQLGYVPQRGGY